MKHAIHYVNDLSPLLKRLSGVLI